MVGKALLFACLFALAALTVAPSSEAHLLNYKCNYSGVNLYPGEYVAQLSTDPNDALSSFIKIEGKVGSLGGCRAWAPQEPCVAMPGWDCNPTDGRHFDALLGLCGRVPCPTWVVYDVCPFAGDLVCQKNNQVYVSIISNDLDERHTLTIVVPGRTVSALLPV